MDEATSAPEPLKSPLPPQIQMLEHEKRVLARLSLTQGAGNRGTRLRPAPE